MGQGFARCILSAIQQGTVEHLFVPSFVVSDIRKLGGKKYKDIQLEMYSSFCDCSLVATVGKSRNAIHLSVPAGQKVTLYMTYRCRSQCQIGKKHHI